jgi:FMN phosphatase YigB (HAD superfamily)
VALDPMLNRRVPTHDVFDTLIARRCIEPANVFAEMEARAGRPGLAQARRRAEQAVAGRAYTLDDIHRQLAMDLQLGEAESAQLRALELAVELDNVVPIADELARLGPESVLVSDMYLPEAHIRALLQRAGAPHRLPLVLTSAGKYEGTVWTAFADHGRQCLHVGDNRHADVDQAARHGMRGRHTRLHAPNATETALRAAGLEQTARLLRGARLATPSGALPAWNAALQAQINLPVLLFSAVMLALHMRGAGLQRALFSSRDGRNLHAVFDAVLPALQLPQLQSMYWYSSRKARLSGDADYLAYCREVGGAGAILVDLCGTGVSLARLLQWLGDAAAPQVMVCQYVDDPLLAARAARACGLQAPAGLQLLQLMNTRHSFSNEVLEFLNFVPEGMVVGVMRVAGTWLPQRHHLEFDAGITAVVQQQQAYLMGLVAQLESAGIARAAGEWAAQPGLLLGALRQALPALQGELQLMNQFFRPEHHGAEATLAHAA